MRSAPLLCLLPVILLSGCVIGGNKLPRPRDLDPGWKVDGPRILAIRAEPPEARPGEVVSFAALIPDPNDEIEGTIWLACPPDEAGGFGCAVDLGALPENPTPDQLAELGVIGFEPGFAPSYTPDASLLAEQTPEQRLEGVNVTIQIAAFPAGDLADTDIDFNSVEVGYKRLVVSEATTPNRNPGILRFLVDGYEIPPGAGAEVDRGQDYELGIDIDPLTIETYEYTTDAGVVESRVEEPYATWYCTGGALNETITIHPFTQATWNAAVSEDDVEDTDGTIPVTCWAVVRDRRGGMTWIEQPLSIR